MVYILYFYTKFSSWEIFLEFIEKIFTISLAQIDMAGLAQLVRASDCGPEGHGFESHSPPHVKVLRILAVANV